MDIPKTETELLERANAIAGCTLSMLAAPFGLEVPHNLLHAKGWIGQIIELNLGADAGSKPEPDFTQLGIELKTLPLDANFKPKETTFINSIDLLNIGKIRWKTSTCYKKLKRVLWIPIEADPSIAVADRRIGNPILWSPNANQEKQLQTDWEELTDLIALGQIESIQAKQGVILQIRPKCANGKSLCPAIGPNGHKIMTLPRGFYLRTQFTQQLLQGHKSAVNTSSKIKN